MSASGAYQLCSGWLGEASPLPQVRLFRRRFSWDAHAGDLELTLFAEGRYHLWCNGVYLGRGPILRHPFRIYLDRYDLRPHCNPGANVLAVTVHTPGYGLHNYIPMGVPGLLCELTHNTPAGRQILLTMDEQWRVTDQSGWRYPAPKRGWALGAIETYDAAVAPQAWQTLDYDDRAWAAPELSSAWATLPQITIEPRPLPDLRYRFMPARQIIGSEHLTAPVIPLAPDARSSELGQQMRDAGFVPAASSPTLQGSLDEQGGGLRIVGLTPERGLALHVDVGAEYVGQPLFTLQADTAGVIDFAYSEIIEHHRPNWLRKGVSYADRIFAPAGVTVWEPLNFSAGRYLTLLLRGFTGNITIERLGWRASEPDLPWTARFTSSRPSLDGIFQLCERTLRIGTQEGLMDCPTREQAAYIGDGLPVAHWLTLLTGDLRHYRYLVREQLARQAPSGLIRSAVFSWRDDTLIDYNLLALTGARDYLQLSGDHELVRQLLPALRRVLAWFDAQCNEAGFFALDWRQMQTPGEYENSYDPARPRITSLNLFIDHPGMGWHNQHEAGIDRRGINAAINFLLVHARRAMAELEETCGDAQCAPALRAQADALAQAAQTAFFNPQHGCFIDGICDGTPLPQISEQTNTWAIMARCCDDATARQIITRLLTEPNETIARSGPYFWCYLLPEMARLGMHELALAALEQRWGVMLDEATTAVWETFAGDELDSRCHPWSCAPLPFLLSHVLGLPGVLNTNNTMLRPRYDLLARASGAVRTPQGEVTLQWRTVGAAVELAGQLPPGFVATLISPAGETLESVCDHWRLTVVPNPN